MVSTLIYNHNTNIDIEKAFLNNEILDIHSINNVVSEGIIRYIKIMISLSQIR